MLDHRRPLAERRRSRRTCGPYRWRPCPPNRGRGFYVSSHDAAAVDEAGSSFRLRFGLAAAHWTCAQDWRGAFGLDAWTPIVARLNHGRGFLAGASLGRGMCAFVDADIFADPVDAAIAADDAAREAAEADMRDGDTEQAA
ncbi:hypothetical protein [Rubrimonas cliftonensis]|nr:hypothetical protein [Rubrimonas cliftonensis]